MVYIILYFTLSWIFNFIINAFFIIAFNQNNIDLNIYKFLFLCTIVNFIKVANQNILIRLIKRQINYNSCLNFEIVIDYIKIFLLFVLAFNYKKFISSYSLLSYFILSIANLLILIIQVIVNYFKPNLFLLNRNYFQIEEQNDFYVIIRDDNNLQNYYSSENKNINCSICLEEQKINEEWSKIICNHEFHKKCILEWLKTNNNCPICRFNI